MLFITALGDLDANQRFSRWERDAAPARLKREDEHQPERRALDSDLDGRTPDALHAWGTLWRLPDPRATYTAVTDLRQKLESEVLHAPWASLLPHAKRHAFFLVGDAVSLVDVALAVARDDQAAVKGWMEDQTLRRPSADELADWERMPMPFEAIIVQPFVLGRPLAG